MKKHCRVREDQSLVWIYRNSNNLEESLIQVSQNLAKEVDLINQGHKLNGQQVLAVKAKDKVVDNLNNLKMTIFIVELIDFNSMLKLLSYYIKYLK